MKYKLTLLIAAIAVMLAGARQRPARAAEQAPVTKLSVDPAPEPVPALQYRLLPPLLDRKPGNAALLYDTALLSISEKDRAEHLEKARKLLEQPFDQFSRDEAERVVGRLRQALHDVEQAALREDCDWQLPLEEGPSLVLPRLSRFRDLGRVLALKARLQIARGQFREAAATLQKGYAMAHNIAEAPVLINHLVALAVGSLMNERIEELIEAPGAPNLYWALAGLPDPLVDMRTSLETEMWTMYLWLPSLRRAAEAGSMSPEAWTHLWKQMLRELRGLTGTRPDERLQTELMSVGWAMLAYPRSKQDLIERGRSPEEVEKMSVAQVIFTDELQDYERLRDDLFKWIYVPYRLARDRLRLEQARERSQRSEQESFATRYVVPLLLPAVGRARQAQARFQQKVAALQCVEALRMYATAHDGSLPDSLDAVRKVHVPIDPVTGEPFQYELRGDTAVLFSPQPEGESEWYRLRYEITIRK